MTEIGFDDKGNIYPYQLIDLELKSFQYRFVISFSASSTRQDIYEKYLVYISDFYKEIVNHWLQWVNGSFITNKINPNDIDLVNLIQAEIFAIKNAEIAKFLTKYGSKDLYKVDGYCIPIYKENDERSELTKEYVKYWRKWFGHDRSRNPKGIIQLNLSEDIINDNMNNSGVING